MKKTLLVFIFLIGLSVNAQTSKELTGKWQLVKWIDTSNAEKDIVAFYKTDKVFQVFLDNSEFQSVVGDEIHKGKWKLSSDNSELTIKSGLISVKFKLQYFDAKKRTIYSPQIGTLDYIKITE